MRRNERRKEINEFYIHWQNICHNEESEHEGENMNS